MVRPKLDREKHPKGLPVVKELEKHLKYWNLYLKIMVRPKLDIPKAYKRTYSSVHYNSLSTNYTKASTDTL